MTRRWMVVTAAAVAFTALPALLVHAPDPPVAPVAKASLPDASAAPADALDPNQAPATARVYGRVVRIRADQEAQCRTEGGQVLRRGPAAVCLWIITQGGVWAREDQPPAKVRL